MMEEVAQQLDHVRQEMAHLLREYGSANERTRGYIYERCEQLGGEVQELVSLLKFSICSANRAVAGETESNPSYADEIARISTESLAAIHTAGLEVAAAITMLRGAHARASGDDALMDP